MRSELRLQESKIKEALRNETSELPLSNTPNGVERFLDSGELVLEPAFLLHPEKIDAMDQFQLRVYPRITNHSNDGWVGIHMGRWYVKLF